MKRSELKKVLKPLIKECIKEVIFDEGVLSGLVSEVLKGASRPEPIVESAPKEEPQPRVSSKRQDSLNEIRKSLTEAIGKDAYGGIDIFEGLDPISKGGSPGASPASSPLQTYAPNDAGVDISSLVSGKWKNLV